MNALKMIGKVIVVLALIVLVIMGISQLQQFATQPREQFLQGQMEARRVLVAGKVPAVLNVCSFTKAMSSKRIP